MWIGLSVSILIIEAAILIIEIAISGRRVIVNVRAGATLFFRGRHFRAGLQNISAAAFVEVLRAAEAGIGIVRVLFLGPFVPLLQLGAAIDATLAVEVLAMKTLDTEKVEGGDKVFSHRPIRACLSV